MPTFFGSEPGQVVALWDSDGIVGLPLAVDGVIGSWFPEFRSVLTGLTVGLDSNFEAMQTMREIIYVYTFGDKISNLIVSGLSFIANCKADEVLGGPNGLEMVMEYYRNNRIALRASPIQIALGTNEAGRFTGFLTNMRAEVTRPELSVANFTFTFTVFPGK
jgi:hypothetical protein